LKFNSAIDFEVSKFLLQLENSWQLHITGRRPSALY